MISMAVFQFKFGCFLWTIRLRTFPVKQMKEASVLRIMVRFVSHYRICFNTLKSITLTHQTSASRHSSLHQTQSVRNANQFRSTSPLIRFMVRIDRMLFAATVKRLAKNSRFPTICRTLIQFAEIINELGHFHLFSARN